MATKRRDVFVWAVCNWLLKHLTTKEYQAFIFVVMTKGKKALDEELGIGNNP